MVFQNSYNILRIILHIYCPTSKNPYVLHWIVEMIQPYPIDLPLLYDWNNMLRNTLYPSLMLLETKCIQ